MQTTIIQRIEKFCDFKKISIRKLSQMIDFNYTTLNNYVNGRRSAIDVDLICKLMSSFDDINIEWILLERGSMLKENSQPEKIFIEKSSGATMEMLKMISELSAKNALLEKKVEQFEKYNIATSPEERYGK